MSDTSTEEAEVKEVSRLKFPNIETNRKLSEPLKVAELKDGETAVYRLCLADIKDISRTDQKGNALLSSPGRKMYHSIKVWDPVQKKYVTIRNIKSYKTVSTENGEKEVPELDRLTFPKGGTLTVTPDEIDKLAFLERHNGNRDNPFRAKDKTAIFYRVNPKRMAIRDMENKLVLLDTLNYVSKADSTKLKVIFENLDKTARSSINASSFETLKRDIFEYALKNPILAMKAADSKDSTANGVKLKIQIMEAEHFNVIKFDEGDDALGAERTWFFIDEKMTHICDVELEVHKIDGLIEHFKSDAGKPTYKLMTERLRQVLTPKK